MFRPWNNNVRKKPNFQISWSNFSCAGRIRLWHTHCSWIAFSKIFMILHFKRLQVANHAIHSREKWQTKMRENPQRRFDSSQTCQPLGKRWENVVKNERVEHGKNDRGASYPQPLYWSIRERRVWNTDVWSRRGISGSSLCGRWSRERFSRCCAVVASISRERVYRVLLRVDWWYD